MGEPYLSAEYTRCPRITIVAGSALGYTTTIEILASVVIITALMACGVLRNDKKSWVKTILEVVGAPGGNAQAIAPISNNRGASPINRSRPPGGVSQVDVTY